MLFTSLWSDENKRQPSGLNGDTHAHTQLSRLSQFGFIMPRLFKVSNPHDAVRAKKKQRAASMIPSVGQTRTTLFSAYLTEEQKKKKKNFSSVLHLILVAVASPVIVVGWVLCDLL